MRKLVLIILLTLPVMLSACNMYQQGPAFEPTVEGAGWDFGDKLGFNARFSASPVLIDDRIFLPSLDGFVYVFDSARGKKIDPKLWSFRTNQGIRSTPAYREGILYFGAFDKKIHGIDISTGQTRFVFDTNGYISSSPLIIDDVLFTGSYDGFFRAIDLSTNQQKWAYDTKARIRGGSTSSDSGVIFSNEEGRLFHLNRDDGSSIWQVDIGAEVYAAPASYEGVLITVDTSGRIKAMDINDGSLKWEFDAPAVESPYTEEFWSSPVIDNEVVYVGSTYGRFYAFALYPSSGSAELVWDAPFETTNGGENRYAIYSTPTIEDDKIIFGSNSGALYCLNKATGSEIWRFMTYGEIRCKPLIIDNMVVFVSNDHYLYGLNIEDGQPVRG